MIKVAICSDKVTAAGEIEKLVFDLCKTKGIPAETEVFYDEHTLKQEISTSQTRRRTRGWTISSATCSSFRKAPSKTPPTRWCRASFI